MRRTDYFPVGGLAGLKQKLLAWADAHPAAVYLDSNGRADTWECLVAAGAADAVQATAGLAFPALKIFQEKKQDWLFGLLGYDLKNEVEKLSSGHFDGLGWPDLYFFQPKTVAGIRAGRLEIFSLEKTPAAVFDEIQCAELSSRGDQKAVALTPRFPQNDYLAAVEAVRRHIVAGDVYEMNLCQEFYAEGTELDPPAVFARLNALAQAPFSAYFRLHERYLLCASPERFLKKRGEKLLSQPIKGTRPRGSSLQDDDKIRAELAASEKDRAENVMIVDLVRNDLARHCRPGSVRVEELFGIHTFPTVHQMISSVSGLLRPGEHPLDALRDAFPMGSMTGAPKVMAMELIERYEQTRRGLYSGAVGYFTPEGDFDFNVVIRGILYHAAARYASVQVGGAIVFDSVPEAEYEECLVKAGAMLRALGDV